MKIGVVITTYNRQAILRRCLENVLDQTCHPDQVVVIDNSCNDLTEKMISADFPEVIYKHFYENIGSAGGYCEGIKIARQNNDFIWILDDDITSEKTSLEELISYIPLLQDKGIFGAMKGGYGAKKNDITEIQGFAWRGTLINSDVIEKVGLPEKKFFLYASDLEYSMRIRKAGYKMYGVFAGKLKDVAPTERDTTSLLGAEKTYYSDAFRLYYSHRNMLYVHLKYRKYGKALRLLLYGARGVALFLCKWKCDNTVAIAEGLYDGFRCRLGKKKKYSIHPAFARMPRGLPRG